MPEFLDDETALILGATSLGAGLATTVAGFGTRALGRVDVERTLALDPSLSEGDARGLVNVTYRLAETGATKLASMGFTASRKDLMRSLHDLAVDTVKRRLGFWNPTSHHAELEKLGHRLKTWHPMHPLPTDELVGVVKTVRLDDGLAAELRDIVAADEFASLWASQSLTDQVRDARDAFARFLRTRVYSGGDYQPGVAYVDRYGGLILHDTEFFGSKHRWGYAWNFELRALGHDV